jgi:hypothetical protein
MSFEHGNEPSDSTKCEEFLVWLRNGCLLKKDSTSCGWLVGWLIGYSDIRESS